MVSKKIRRKFTQYKYRFAANAEKGKVLELGIGNDSPKRFKELYPEAEYHGIDKDLDYNLSQESIKLLDKFFQVNLDTDNLDEIPEDTYDYVVVAHVIEHIDRGEDIVRQLAGKVKKGGMFYLEYPSEASGKFPKFNGLNFWEDLTHKRFYDRSKLEDVMKAKGFEIIRSEVKRDPLRIIGIPFMLIKSRITMGYFRGSAFWDLFGFAEFILAKKVR